MRPGWRSILFLALLAGLQTLGGAAAALDYQAAPVTKRVLDNGLTILVREDRSAPVVSAQAWVRAGSITEGEWMGAGLSHILEHMLFKGTTTRGVAEIAQEVDDQGGYINAYTAFEQTVYYIDLPAENWSTAVEILADCMMNATIPEEELLKEKNVILREMAMNHDNPQRRVSRLLWSTAYLTHPYRHPVIGYPEVYDRVQHADVVAYYQRYYVPNNLMFVVVGDVNAAAVIEKIAALTADFTRAPLDPPHIPAEPPQLSQRRQDSEMAVQLSEIGLAWHIPDFTHPDVPALDVLAIILGEGRSSRLYREIQERRGLVHSISAGSYTPAQPGLFYVSATADPAQREPAIAAILAEVNRLKTGRVARAEVAKAVKVSLSSHLSRLKTMSGQAADLGQNEFFTGDPLFSTVYLASLDRVTGADVQRVARAYLAPHNLSIATLNPVDAAPASAADARPPQAGPIQKFVLPNGLTLLVRPDPKLPLVSFQAVFKGGLLAETEQNNGLTQLTARMLLKGTRARSAEQIADSLEAVGGSISYFSGNNSFGISAETLRADLPLALDVLADVIQNPTFPAALLERERAQQIAALKSQQDQMLPAAQQLLRDQLFERHPYRFNSLGHIPAIESLTRADLVAFHQALVRPDNMALCVFGDVDPAAVHEAVRARFGGRPRGAAPLPQPEPEQVSGHREQTVTRPRAQAVLILGYGGVDVAHPDRFALEILAAAYSGQGSRVFLRIRDELGLAYYVGAYQLLGLHPGYFAFYVGSTAENLEQCRQEFLAEIAKLKTDGLSSAELERARNSLLGRQQVQLQDNSAYALQVALDELTGLGYDFHQTIADRYRAVTADDIRRVANRYFGDRPNAVAIVRPIEEN